MDPSIFQELTKLTTFYNEDSFNELFFVSLIGGIGKPQPLGENPDLELLEKHCYLLPAIGPDKANHVNPYGALQFLSRFYEISIVDLSVKILNSNVRVFDCCSIRFYSIADVMKFCV